MLKGYLDRVLSHGFAYKTENGESKGLLQDKAMQQFITIGSSVAKYQEYGVDKSLNHCLINGLFNYCGIENVDYTLFGDIHIIDNAARQAMLDEAAEKTTAKIDRTFTIVSTIIGKQQMSETQVNNFSLISRLFGNLFYRSPTDPILSGVFDWLQQQGLSQVWALSTDKESEAAIDNLQMKIDLTLLDQEYQKIVWSKR